MKINKEELEKRAQAYWKRGRSYGIGREREENLGLKLYIHTLLEKKNLISNETRRELYRTLGRIYADTDHHTLAWRYFSLADGAEKAKAEIRKSQEAWLAAYRLFKS